MSFLDEITEQAEHAEALAARAGHIRGESQGNQNYLKFYKYALIPVALGSLLLPVVGILPSIWAEENAGNTDPEFMQLGSHKQRGWIVLAAVSMYGRRGIAMLLPVFVGILGGMLVAGAFALKLVSGSEVWGITELWTAINAYYVIKHYFRAKRAALAAKGAHEYLQEQQGGN